MELTGFVETSIVRIEAAQCGAHPWRAADREFIRTCAGPVALPIAMTPDLSQRAVPLRPLDLR